MTSIMGCLRRTLLPSTPCFSLRDRDFFIDNLLVRTHFIIEMVLIDRPCTMRVWFPYSR